MDPAAAPSRLARLALGVLLVLVLCWVLPWADVVAPDGAVVAQVGAERGGVLAAGALLLLWGLCVTVVVTRRPRGLRAGAALTDAALALLATGLLVAEHPWLPRGGAEGAWIPIFLPLGLLALLDAAAHATRDEGGGEVALIRAAAGLFAAGALFVEGAYVPALLLLWLGGAPLLLHRLAGSLGIPRTLGLLQVAAAALAFAAPWVEARALDASEPAVTYLPRYGWAAMAVLMLAIAGIGALRSPAPRDA